MKNYDDVPLRKPLPAPGPVPDVVEETTKTGLQENNSQSRAGNKTETSNDNVTKDGNNGVVTKDGKVGEDMVDGSVVVISPTSPRSPTEFPKPAVKGKPVDIPVVPELKKIDVKQGKKSVEKPKEERIEVKIVKTAEVSSNAHAQKGTSPKQQNVQCATVQNEK